MKPDNSVVEPHKGPTWKIKNCLSIGLSANFIEPLEASSIGMSIQQSFMLANRIHNYNQANINEYNREVENMMINVRDFVFLHYMCKRNDTDFWKDLKSLNFNISQL